MKRIMRSVQIAAAMSLLLFPFSRGEAMEPLRPEHKSPECGANADVLVAIAKDISAKDDSQTDFSEATPDGASYSTAWRDSWIGSSPSAQTSHAWSRANHSSIVTSCAASLKARGYRVVNGQEGVLNREAKTATTSLIVVSNLSYDKARGQAMVYVEDSCEKKGAFPQLMCGLYEYLVLTKIDGKWIVTGERPTVIP